jgi:hypothetical protein
MGRKAGASESTLVLVLPLGPVVAEAGMPVTSATFPSFCPCNLPDMLNTAENMVKLAICAGAAHVAFAFSTVVDVVFAFAFGAVVNVAFAFGAGVVDVKGADDDGGEDAGKEEVDTKTVTTSVIVEGAADTVIVVVAVVVVGGSVSVCVCVCMAGCEEGSWRE